MPASITDIYRSSNGDRWQLVGTGDPACMLVRHIPNASSGGQTSEITVADFLSIDGSGPEYAALRRHLANMRMILRARSAFAEALALPPHSKGMHHWRFTNACSLHATT